MPCFALFFTQSCHMTTEDVKNVAEVGHMNHIYDTTFMVFCILFEV